MIQGREVPGKLTSGLTEGIEKDPKFVRFHQRLAASETLSELRAERTDLRVPNPRFLALALLLAIPLVCVALFTPGKWAFIELGLLALVLCLDEIRERRTAYAKAKRLTEIDDQVQQLESLVYDIDRQAESSIRIVDPSMFGGPKQAQDQKGS
jgi:hypothetical protein